MAEFDTGQTSKLVTVSVPKGDQSRFPRQLLATQKGPRQAPFWRRGPAFFVCDSFPPSLCSALGNHP